MPGWVMTDLLVTELFVGFYDIAPYADFTIIDSQIKAAIWITANPGFIAD